MSITHDFLIQNGFVVDGVFKFYVRQTKIGAFIIHYTSNWNLCDIDMNIIFDSQERLKEVYEVLTK
jgi:hypothetical protein